MANKIIVHCCGGAGVGLESKALRAINNCGEGFAKLVFNYIDTSRANYDAIDPEGDLWLVKSASHSKGIINGSGSERGENAQDIIKSVPEYLDSKGYRARVDGEFHMVVFSASGGSGSILAPVIIQNLAKLNIPAIAVFVGDNKDMLSAINTKNTIASLDGIARATGKALASVYYNNSAAGEVSKVAETKVNNLIYNTVMGIATFLSGEHESIDNKDMLNIICMNEYTNVKAQPGLYSLVFVAGNPVVPKGTVPFVARTLTSDNVPGDIEFNLFHHKEGIIKSDNVKSVYKDFLPLHLITFANTLTIEAQVLQEYIDQCKATMNSITMNQLAPDTDAVDMGDGIVL